MDVTVAGSQKGLMLPPGLSFNAISDKALAASREARLPRSYWSWDEIIASNAIGYFPYTPATNLLYGLHEAIDMLLEEGLANVFRAPQSPRRGDAACGAGMGARAPLPQPRGIQQLADRDHDAGRTRCGRFPARRAARATTCPSGWDWDACLVRVFRSRPPRLFNDLTLCGTLCGVEMGLAASGVPHKRGGVDAALAYLSGSEPSPRAAQDSPGSARSAERSLNAA